MGLVRPAIFNYTQATPAVTWEIEHNLGGNGGQGIPIVDVYILDVLTGLTEKMLPMSVQIVDANNITLTFSQARQGSAVVCA